MPGCVLAAISHSAASALQRQRGARKRLQALPIIKRSMAPLHRSHQAIRRMQVQVGLAKLAKAWACDCLCCLLLRLLLGDSIPQRYLAGTAAPLLGLPKSKARCRMQVGVGAIKSLAAQRAPMSMSSILEVRKALTL